MFLGLTQEICYEITGKKTDKNWEKDYWRA